LKGIGGLAVAVFGCVGVAARAGPAAGPVRAGERPAVAALLEDNADTLLPQLTNPTGDPGEGHVERSQVFSGRSGVRIVPMQRFHPHLPGWNYRIVEKPAAGEYRYVRWAWKADGCAGTMVQFHIETGWSVRYVAGNNDPGWGAKSVAADPPAGWVVVTRDLFADFGPCTVTGIALAAFRGRCAYFDHVYFGRTVEDLDRVDATGLRDGPPPRLAAGDLGRLWAELGGADDAKAYRAYWTLAAVPEQAVPFLAETLSATASPSPQLAARITGWVADLDAPEYAVREEATRRLADHPRTSGALLRAALDDAGPEARVRIDSLLRAAAAPGAAARDGKAVRLLRYLDTPAAAALLADLEHAGRR
jgi:hypothetical protein